MPLRVTYESNASERVYQASPSSTLACTALRARVTERCSSSFFWITASPASLHRLRSIWLYLHNAYTWWGSIFNALYSASQASLNALRRSRHSLSCTHASTDEGRSLMTALQSFSAYLEMYGSSKRVLHRSSSNRIRNYTFFSFSAMGMVSIRWLTPSRTVLSKTRWALSALYYFYSASIVADVLAVELVVALFDIGSVARKKLF